MYVFILYYFMLIFHIKMKKIILTILFILLPNVLIAQDVDINLHEISNENNIEGENVNVDVDVDVTEMDWLNEKNIMQDDYEIWNNLEYEDWDNVLSDVLNEDIDEYIDDNLNNVWDDNWLGNIHFWFCNEWTDRLSDSLSMAVEQWSTSNACLLFYNDSNQDISLNMEYTMLWKDQFWQDSCTNDTSFEQYITNISQIKRLTIPSWQSVKLDLELNFPIWIDWNVGGCVEYDVESNKEHNNGGLVIETVVKKAFHMKFFVGGIQDIKNELEINNIQSYFNENKELIIKFDISNIWNLEDSLDISWNISNIFWFSKNFVIEWWKILPDRTLPIEINVWTIASYGWIFNININIVSTPFFSYDISNSSIDPTLLEPKEFTASTTFFQMPWLILIILIILILLIITIFRKPKQKVVYVQAPQQPGYQQPPYTQPEQPQYQAPQQPVQPQQPQYPNNSQYWQPIPQQNPQPTPPQYNPNN